MDTEGVQYTAYKPNFHTTKRITRNTDFADLMLVYSKLYKKLVESRWELRYAAIKSKYEEKQRKKKGRRIMAQKGINIPENWHQNLDGSYDVAGMVYISRKYVSNGKLRIKFGKVSDKFIKRRRLKTPKSFSLGDETRR